MSKFKENIRNLESEFDLISDSRKMKLELLAFSISELQDADRLQGVVFVCTHNSRRSQLAEIWFRYAMHHYGLNFSESYSAGTETTAFNYRMVEAIKEFGFEISQLTQSDNPVYQLCIDGHPTGPKMFSKKLDHSDLPDENFIAIMVCSDADTNCPVVPGVSLRVSLPYLDPKDSDGTPNEKTAYKEKVMEIGREMLFLIHKIMNQE